MEKKLVVWVCDDDPVFLEFMEQLIQEEWGYSTTCFSSPETMYDALRHVEKLPDCIFLDILFGQDTSLKVGTAIREDYPSVRIVYVTGYRQFLPEVFEADPVYFLEKPVDANKLSAAFEAAKRSGRPKSEADILTLQKGKSYLRIPLTEIDCIESDRRKICAHCGENTVVWNERLPEVQKRLPRICSRALTRVFS